MRLGIMGGTFDPIHYAHIAAAATARRAAELEGVLFVPSGNPPHKTAATSAEDRVEMVTLAVRDLPWAEVSRLEVDRGGRIYTVDTLDILHRERPGDRLYVIVGSDALRDMTAWRDAPRAMRLCEVIAVARPGFNESQIVEYARMATKSTGATITLVRSDCPDISSSRIRENVRHGLPVDNLLPSAVADFIQARGLYL